MIILYNDKKFLFRGCANLNSVLSPKGHGYFRNYECGKITYLYVYKNYYEEIIRIVTYLNLVSPVLQYRVSEIPLDINFEYLKFNFNTETYNFNFGFNVLGFKCGNYGFSMGDLEIIEPGKGIIKPKSNNFKHCKKFFQQMRGITKCNYLFIDFLNIRVFENLEDLQNEVYIL